jgi:hypothetical protein
MVGLRNILGCLHSRVEIEKADPRRKLPGGQSSPQSLRGIANIFVLRGSKVRLKMRNTVHCYISCLLEMAPSLAISAEAMGTIPGVTVLQRLS